jgi:lipid II:glycine glycyltransferase (peptidoglycan interpeptide bridge formation enzyme)
LNKEYRIQYIPRGPMLCTWEDEHLRRKVLSDLRQLAIDRKAIFIKIDPEVIQGKGISDSISNLKNDLARELRQELIRDGWLYSAEQVQFQNTIVVDLQPEPGAILSRMKQKTRYNIRLAERKGIAVRSGGTQDIDLLYRMYAQTALRDGFTIRDRDYYQHVWETFHNADMADFLIAEVEGQAVAAVIVFRFAGRAWYMYGMSSDLHREKMPNHLLQWQAMLKARREGCYAYDMWGAPDTFDPSDDMWGVYRFKEGFGGEVIRYIGAWDLPVQRGVYYFYNQIMPRFLSWLRLRGKIRTRSSLMN